MFEPTSRYASLETATLTLPDGRVTSYVRRRFLPSRENMNLLAEVAVTEGDRLDLITWRTLGDPEQFWRVCDANGALNPFDLAKEPGDLVRVAVPEL